MYCHVEGIVVASKIRKPDQGASYRNVMVLQQVDGDAVLVPVKDMDLIEYADGEKFSEFCRVSNWSFNGKSGMSTYIIHKDKAPGPSLASAGDVI